MGSDILHLVVTMVKCTFKKESGGINMIDQRLYRWFLYDRGVKHMAHIILQILIKAFCGAGAAAPQSFKG